MLIYKFDFLKYVMILILIKFSSSNEAIPSNALSKVFLSSLLSMGHNFIQAADPSPKPTRSPTTAPTKSPTAEPTPKPTRSPTTAPTKSPTAMPTVTGVRNATIIDGYLTIDGVTSYVGKNSSNINTVITTYFKKSSYTQMTINLKYEVWLNGSNSLSYLTISGNYTADVPIVLPHQFVLVMDNARLEAIEDFPSNTANYVVEATTIKGNPNPDTNTQSISVTNWAIIVANSVYYSAVVSPKGPSGAYIGCRNMPQHLGDHASIIQPAGIYMFGAGAILIDGIYIDNCGLNNGNIALYGTGRAEVANCILADARTRGIWIIIMAYTVIHDTEIFGCYKFGIDLDANAGPVTVLYRNYIHDNRFQSVFIEQGAFISVTADNDLPRNQNSVSFYNNLFAQLCSDHVVLSNKCYESTSHCINVGSLNDPVVGFWPTTDSYIIGNTVYDSGTAVALEASRFGFQSNGPAYGIFVLGNSDTHGQSSTFWSRPKGGLVVSDPMRRMLIASGITPTASPTFVPTVSPTARPTNESNTADPTRRPTANPTPRPSPTPTVSPTLSASAINVTIDSGVITSYIGQPLVPITIGTVVGTTCQALQTFINTYFSTLYIGDASLIPWMWQPDTIQVVLNLIHA